MRKQTGSVLGEPMTVDVFGEVGAQAQPDVRAQARARTESRPEDAGPGAGALVSGVQAAGELGLSRTEFARALQLGIVRPGPPAPGGAARYARAELERVRAAEALAGGGWQEALRERVATVAGAEAAAVVLGVGPSRFTRLARCGHLVPVGYRINRYRAVVWLYLTAELREFAAREPAMLRGTAPPADRALMAAKADLRPRMWRGRHVGLLLRRAADPWERAAVLASVLPEEEVRQAVPDPGERIVLAALAPPPPYGHPQVPAAAAVALPLLKAGPPEEVHWYRTSLDFALSGARGQSKSTGERGPI
ncbi:DUF6397 family protein [Streptomyces sp. CB00455]|uniref:DUF6397 family protein n=1 Tax=Streptomyces sp. CB00455 TaxID=1703927 RepID=UPI000B190C66|nr:DUF6397 family protein [Streptomyces sp. CB00455]